MVSRGSFAAITEKIHKDAANQNLYGSNETILPDKEDFQIAEEIVEYLRTNSSNNCLGATGEWSWLQKNKQANFLGKLADLDSKSIAYDLANMFRTDATYGYVSPSFIDTFEKEYKTISNILCDIDTVVEFTGIKNVNELAAMENIGNPY